MFAESVAIELEVDVAPRLGGQVVAVSVEIEHQRIETAEAYPVTRFKCEVEIGEKVIPVMSAISLGPHRDRCHAGCSRAGARNDIVVLDSRGAAVAPSKIHFQRAISGSTEPRKLH